MWIHYGKLSTSMLRAPEGADVIRAPEGADVIRARTFSEDLWSVR